MSANIAPKCYTHCRYLSSDVLQHPMESSGIAENVQTHAAESLFKPIGQRGDLRTALMLIWVGTKNCQSSS